MRIRRAQSADLRAAHLRHVRAAAQRRAQIPRYRPHVGARADPHCQPQPRQLEREQLQLVNRHRARLDLQRLPRPRGPMRRHPAHLHRAVQRRRLLNRPAEPGQLRLKLRRRQRRHIRGRDHLSLAVVGVRRRAQQHRRLVGLGIGTEVFVQPRRHADEDRQQPRRQRIQRAAVAHAAHVGPAPHLAHDVVRGRTARLVHQKDRAGMLRAALAPPAPATPPPRASALRSLVSDLAGGLVGGLVVRLRVAHVDAARSSTASAAARSRSRALTSADSAMRSSR